jgi:hypothetical protein
MVEIVDGKYEANHDGNDRRRGNQSYSFKSNTHGKQHRTKKKAETARAWGVESELAAAAKDTKARCLSCAGRQLMPTTLQMKSAAHFSGGVHNAGE